MERCTDLLLALRVTEWWILWIYRNEVSRSVASSCHKISNLGL